MATYSSFAELQGNILQYLDSIIFEHEGYRVDCQVRTIGLFKKIRNEKKIFENIGNKIFELLGLDAWDFCEQHYDKLHNGWECRKTEYPNSWPLYLNYESLTRVVLELFRMIQETKELKETSTTLFVD